MKILCNEKKLFVKIFQVNLFITAELDKDDVKLLKKVPASFFTFTKKRLTPTVFEIRNHFSLFVLPVSQIVGITLASPLYSGAVEFIPTFFLITQLFASKFVS